MEIHREQLAEEKVFKDPIHKYIYVQDEIIWKLINTKEFQRLRRIRQLGTSFVTFHGAEHSRFSHSLGVYEITRKIISQFERVQAQEWNQEEKRVALCAALLHDVGHGPFSHCMEEVFETNHEQWTIDIIQGNTEVNEVLLSIHADFPKRVASVIQKTYDNPIVVNMVTSQLDADRMDYLLRDAYYTGVNYGTFDLERILRVMRPHDGKIVVKESGMHAIEDYLMSRYQMYWQVYFHPVSRSSEIILRKILQRVKQLYIQKYSFNWMLPEIESLIKCSLSVSDYLELDESIMQTAFNRWQREEDAVLAELCQRFLQRKLYTYVVVDPSIKQRWNEIVEQCEASGIDAEYDLEIDSPVNLAYEIYHANSAIWIMDDQGTLHNIATKSPIVGAMTGIQEGQYHIYYNEQKIRQVRDRLTPELQHLFQLDRFHSY